MAIHSLRQFGQSLSWVVAGPGKGTAPGTRLFTAESFALTCLVQHLERALWDRGEAGLVLPEVPRPCATVELHPLPHGLNGDRLEDPTLAPGRSR